MGSFREGLLHPKVEPINVEFEGVRGIINSHFSACDNCGSEVASSLQVSTNKRLMRDFKEWVII